MALSSFNRAGLSGNVVGVDSYWNVLTATNAETSVDLSWPAAGGSPSSYEISINGAVTNAGNVTSFSPTGLTIGVSHEFKVRPVFSNGSKGGWSFPKSGNPLGFNAATGGTETTISDYNGTGQTWKVHTFSSAGTLSVTVNNNPFTYLVVGGGAGGGGGVMYQYLGAAGAAGVKRTGSQIFPIGNSPISIGGAGGGGAVSAGSSGSGGTSSLALFGSTTISATGGSGVPHNTRTGGSNADFSGATHTASIASGGGAGAAGNASATGGGAGFVSTITGASITYGKGGYTADYVPPPNLGDGGCGRGSAHGAGFRGSSGVVIVAYRIG